MEYCSQCRKNTSHKEQVQARKMPLYKNTFWGGVKQFVIETLIIGGSTDLTLKTICDLDRFITCTVCGKKTLDNHGQEFE